MSSADFVMRREIQEAKALEEMQEAKARELKLEQMARTFCAMSNAEYKRPWTARDRALLVDGLRAWDSQQPTKPRPAAWRRAIWLLKKKIAKRT